MYENESWKMLIDVAIEIGRNNFIRPQYREKTKDDVILASIVSKFCKHTGERIQNVMIEAFEDSNYHGLSSFLTALFELLNSDVKYYNTIGDVDIIRKIIELITQPTNKSTLQLAKERVASRDSRDK